jgi:transcription elongation factor Elf1
MSDNYPEGSMRGSGIYSQDVDYDEFECENEECGKTNEAGTTSTDDWGNYTIECEFCGATFDERSLEQDREDYDADRAYEAWRDERDERGW